MATLELTQHISPDSVVVVAKNQVSTDLAGEAVILNLESGMYYGLDEVGARIWELIQQPQSVPVILETLLNEYEVEPGQCENDLLVLLQSLATAKLIEIHAPTVE